MTSLVTAFVRRTTQDIAFYRYTIHVESGVPTHVTAKGSQLTDILLLEIYQTLRAATIESDYVTDRDDLVGFYKLSTDYTREGDIVAIPILAT